MFTMLPANSRWLRCKRYRRSGRDTEAGFSLAEAVMSLSITAITLAVGTSIWWSGWRNLAFVTEQMQSLDDGWLLYHALNQDLTGSQRVQADGSALSVTLNDGEEARYRLSPDSHLVLRTLNGYGEVVLSTGVDSLHWQTGKTGLQVDVAYAGEGGAHELQFTLSAQANAL